MNKREQSVSFAIDTAIERLREAVAPYPPAAMFGLADEGFNSPFEQLLACIISIRTYDETTLPCARRLFAAARTPAAMAALEPAEIDALISPCTFHEPKAQQMWEIARTLEEQHGGQLPCDFELLTSFRGVGPKCANLALGIACGIPSISVDVHVHRVTNRWGYVATRTPEQTMAALEKVLPQPDLDRDQPPAGAVWQAYLHGDAAAVLNVPAAGDVRAGWSGKPKVV